MKSENKLEEPLCFCGEQFNDYQKEEIRKLVCRNNSLKFKDEEDNKYCVFHFPSFEKKEEFELAYNAKIEIEDYLFYGTWFPIEIDFTNHIFGKYANFCWTQFNLKATFEGARFVYNCDFRCSVFKNVTSFKNVEFHDSNEQILPTSFYAVTFESIADFEKAIFSKEADFSNSHFQKGYCWDKASDFLKFNTQTSFAYSVFKEKANFNKVKFGKPFENEIGDSFSFGATTFEGYASFQEAEFLTLTNFTGAVFKQNADFKEILFSESLSFDGAKFETFAKFSAKHSNHKSWNKDGFEFSNVEIEKPERIFFQTVQLKPDKFTNTDIRKFDFTDIEWKPKNFWSDWARFKDIAWWKDEVRTRKTSYISLEKIYRRFASFAEENNDYRSASKFRYTAFDIQRITPWYGRLPITLLWWYKWTSGYGEQWLRSLIILLLLIFAFFPYIYTIHNFTTCSKDRPISSSLAICESNNSEISRNCSCSQEPLNFTEAIVQSLTTATLQNVEYRKPMTWRAELWIILEKIFVPLQAALLALAIRRKFMR